jgi:hypothetical protein
MKGTNAMVSNNWQEKFPPVLAVEEGLRFLNDAADCVTE